MLNGPKSHEMGGGGFSDPSASVTASEGRYEVEALYRYMSREPALAKVDAYVLKRQSLPSVFYSHA